MTTDTVAEASTNTTDAGGPDTTDTTATTEQPTAQSTEPKAPEAQAPESYDLKMPEGVELDTAAAEEFTAIAKELKLPAEAAQKFADVGAKMAQRQVENHAKLVESWTESVKTDKEIGGDKLAENLGIARKALDQFGTPELKDVLNMTGFGNHPAVIRAFYKIGKAISEDGFVKGSTPSAGPTDIAKRMFPTMN